MTPTQYAQLSAYDKEIYDIITSFEEETVEEMEGLDEPTKFAYRSLIGS